MRYSVRFQGLLEAGERFAKTASKLKNEIAELKESITALKRLSYLDAAIAALERERENMLEQLQKLLTMYASLIRIYQVYRTAEVRVLDDLEEGYKRFEITEKRTFRLMPMVRLYASSSTTSIVKACAAGSDTADTSDAYINVSLSS